LPFFLIYTGKKNILLQIVLLPVIITPDIFYIYLKGVRMKYKVLCGLLSCMLVAPITAAQDNLLKSAVVPTLAGAGSGALYTLAKSYYAHNTYELARTIEGQASDLGKTLAFGAEIGVLSPEEPFSPKGYINPLVMNMMLGAALGGSIGVLCGFYKNDAKEGCKIAAGSFITFIAAVAGANMLGNKIAKRNRYENGWYTPTWFRYPRS